jgi:hypothetical protein
MKASKQFDMLELNKPSTLCMKGLTKETVAKKLKSIQDDAHYCDKLRAIRNIKSCTLEHTELLGQSIYK